MKKLVIVQPYVPAYRLPFFTMLIERLMQENISCNVVAGVPDAAQAVRGDAVSASWLIHAKQNRVTFAGKTLTFGGTRKHWKDADAVIVGHLGSSLDTYLALFGGRQRKVGVWGHIKSYVSEPHPIDSWLERWQLRKADQVFAYTPGGTAYAIEAGVPAERVTTVFNAVDSSALINAQNALTATETDTFIETHRLEPNWTVCFIGGLDASKRIAFLAEVLDKLWTIEPRVKLLVAGKGSDWALLDAAADRNQVIRLGYADDRLRALTASVSRGIVMPGRIGLVAVDALILDRPIFTTDWPFHAPESEYLVEGESRITLTDDPSSFATELLQHLANTQNVSVSPSGASPERPFPTLEQMVDNYAQGVVSLLAR